MKKAAGIAGASTLLIIGALPVLAYPLLMLVGAMSFDAGSRGLLHQAVFYGINVYPLIYIFFCVAAVQAMRKGEHGRASSWASYPVLFALVLALAASAY